MLLYKFIFFIEKFASKLKFILLCDNESGNELKNS